MKTGITDNQIVKHQNLKLLLDNIRNLEIVSRAELARITGLTKATISSLIKELYDKKLIIEIGEGKSTGGRRPVLFCFDKNSYISIGIDLADEKVIRGYMCNLKAEILLEIEKEYVNNYETILQCVKNIIKILIRNVPKGSKIAGIGVSAAGIVDPISSSVLFSANFDIEGNRLSEDLKNEFDLPVFIENESNAAAIAEKEFGNGVGYNNIIYLSYGKGIGGSIIINNDIFYGGFYGAGEIGHIVVDPNGSPCRCGSLGCLETCAGYSYLLKCAEKVKGTKLEIADISNLYLSGDNDIVEIVDRQAYYIGKALAISSNLLNIQCMIIGGNITCYGESFLEKIKYSLRKYIIKYYRNKTCLQFSRFGKNAVGIGAASLVIKKVWNLELI